MASENIAAKTPVADYLADFAENPDLLISSAVDILDGLRIVAATGGAAEGYQVMDRTVPGSLTLAIAMLERAQALQAQNNVQKGA